MLSVNNTTLFFGEQLIFDNISFIINNRDKIGLIGRNGSGKTTLFNILSEEMVLDNGTIKRPKHYRTGYVKQHIKFTEDTLLKEGCLGLKPEDCYNEWMVEKILLGLGFSQDDFGKDPKMFSGGFQVRINLAKVLVNEPDLLLLDEPTNYLDLPSIRWLANFLKKWRHELIIISHDRNFMDSITNHTMILHRKGVKKLKGNTIKMYEKLAEEEEIYEKTRKNEEKRNQKIETFIERFRSKASLATRVQSKVKMLEKREKKEKLSQEKKLDFKFKYEKINSKILLKANNISFSYEKENPYLINDFSLTVNNDDRIAIIGRNGKGKTTLLKILNNMLTQNEGAIKLSPKTSIGYFEQTNQINLNLESTIEDELMKSSVDKSFRDVRCIAGTMMFSKDLVLKKIKVLSGGEKARVLLGKVLLKATNLLLLDEPTHHLDIDSCDSLLEALSDFEGAFIIVTHNESFLHHVEKFVVFDHDRIFTFEGSYKELLEKFEW